MKKVFLGVLVCCVVFLLAGCKKSKTVDVLEQTELTDFPEPEKKGTRLDSDTYSYEMTKEEWENYASTIYDYLLLKEFEYFGVGGEVISSLFGGGPTYELVKTSCLEDHLLERDTPCYQFVCYREVNENQESLHDICITLIYYEESNKVNRWVIYDNVFSWYKLKNEEQV